MDVETLIPIARGLFVGGLLGFAIAMWQVIRRQNALINLQEKVIMELISKLKGKEQ